MRRSRGNQRVAVSEAAGWGEFPNTVLYFRDAGKLKVDLREPVSDTSRMGFDRLGFEQSFGIVTSCNPMGVLQSPAINARLMARLQKEVLQLNVVNVGVDACSADRSHCEPSVALALDRDALIAIAARHDQLAIFWFDGEAFWIFPVRSRNMRLRLPLRE
jgi:uncharacterized protein DUF3293